MKRVNYALFSAQSLAASFNSSVIDLRQVDRGSLQITTLNITDNTGQFTFQGSNDNVNFIDVVVSPAIAVLANADTSFLVNLSSMGFDYGRIKFVAAGGTPNGTATCTVVKKSNDA